MRHGQRETGKDRKETGEVRIRDRIGQALGIPSDAVGLSNGFMAELRGRSGVSVRGCKRILNYSREAIRLDTRDGEVTVAGEGLTCTMYCADTIGIEGRIVGVYFENCRSALLCRLSDPSTTEDAE